MRRMILLDSGRLGMLVRAPSKSRIVRCLTWLKASLATGALVVISEIAHYEMRRELLRTLQGSGPFSAGLTLVSSRTGRIIELRL
jgi:hypothetical protein